MKNVMPKSSLRCPECSARLTESNAGGPCPACLMRLGMKSWQENQSLNQFTMEPTIDAGRKAAVANVSLAELAEKFPQFELLHLVGSGGMGSVFCARQKSLNRLVALKIIKPEANMRAEFADRFVREAHAMAQLNHPNIITVHDFGEVDGIYYFAMEYVDGVNLRQMLKGKKLSAKHALEIVPAVCDALQYAHDKGIVHRDIKPENILIDTEGVVKIADFGLAKLLDQETAGPQLTQANHVMGTMHYMAPEQIERPLDVDHRADIYSLGVVIYELLTGELPLGRFAPPSEKVTVDVRLDEIVLQSLAKEPALRYQRVSDVKSELNSVTPITPQVVPAVAHAAESPIPAMPAPAANVSYAAKPAVAARVTDNPALTGPIPNCGLIAGVFHPRTWGNALYLLMALPLGIVSFVLVVTGLSAGIGTLIVWVGIPILLLTFAGVRGMMAMDRSMTRHLLRTNVPVVRYQHVDETKSTIDRAKALAFSAETWKGVLYMLSKLPLGIVSFTLCIVLVTVPLSMIASPVGVIFFDSDVEIPGIPIEGYPLSAILSVLGLCLAPLAARAISGMAWVNAQWAKLWLSRR